MTTPDNRWMAGNRLMDDARSMDSDHSMTSAHSMTDARSTVATGWSAVGVARNILAVLIGTAVVALAAQIAIPFKPVPITMQTLAVVLVAWRLGAGRGFASLALYGTLGSMGAPIFAAGSSGAGASSGFIVGFVLAAAFVGAMAARRPLAGWRAVAVFAAGLAIPYVPGLIWLSAMTGMGAPWSAAVLGAGVVPFIPGDLLKLALASSAAGAWAAMTRRTSS